MTGARISGPSLLEWTEAGYATAPDGTRYVLTSEWECGTPPRIWRFEIRRPGQSRWTGDDFNGLPTMIEGHSRDDFAPSTNRRTVMNRAERHAREFHAGSDA